MRLATLTKQAIDKALEADQGAKYRTLLHESMREAVELVADAFRGQEDGFRSHLGASLIGRDCARELWYSFRWATLQKHEGRMVRLFNRGHLEEPRFVALLRTIGCQVWQYDENKKQFRVSSQGGHFGGSLDSVLVGCPDLPPGTPALGEFKTHNDKSFDKLVKVGVHEAKPTHWIQMQTYMSGFQLKHALYGAVNKNTDDIHWELIEADPEQALRYNERAGNIISLNHPPPKINSSPGWFGCKFCDHRLVCHHNADANRNCRTCIFSRPVPGGDWVCTFTPTGLPADPRVLSKEEQLAGCPSYRWIAQ